MRDEHGGHRVLVELEGIEPIAGERFGHPVPGEESQLAREIAPLLAELSYGRPHGKRLVRLMEAADRQRLAAGLARGLTSAGPHERVVFLLRVDDSGQVPWFTPDERLTRGIAWVDLDGRFNLAFDLIDDRVDLDDPDPYDPTQRAQTRARLVSETGEHIAAADDGAQRLWVVWQLLPSSDATSSDATPSN